MKNLESNGNDPLHNKEKALMEHNITPKDRLENQIVLAVDLFKKIHPEVQIDDGSNEDRNKIMIFWTKGGEESYSKAYRLLENDPNFKNHPRLQGDIFRITAEDVKYYLENKALPED